MRRLLHGERLAAVSAVALLVVMFAFKWFGVDGIPGRTRSLVWTEDAWNGLTLIRWVMLLTILVAAASPFLHATQRTHGTKTSTSMAVATLGSLTSLLVIYRVAVELPASNQVVDQKLGAYLGVLCALGIALGGWEAVREERAFRAAPVAHRPRPVDGGEGAR